MATTQTTRAPRKRLGLTKVQRRKIRKWRTQLGVEMWSANDNMYDLRLKYREQERAWTVNEIKYASRIVNDLVKKIIFVRKELVKFLKKTELAVQYRRRLKGAVDGMKIALGYLQDLLPMKVRERLAVWEREDEEQIFITTFNTGMKALRASWTQMFYTTQAKDIRRFKLSADESEAWHEVLARTGHVDASKAREFVDMAESQGVVMHVYDIDNELVLETMPTWEFSGYAEKSALRQSKKARQQWNNVYRNKVPATVTEFKQALSPAQQREVTKFLKEHPNETFTLATVAGLTDIDIVELEHESAKLLSPYSEFVENPADDTTLEDVFKDSGLHRAIWSMDLED